MVVADNLSKGLGVRTTILCAMKKKSSSAGTENRGRVNEKRVGKEEQLGGRL
jgi:hypothetical protein